MSGKSKWNEFDSLEYRIVDLGRPARFLIPVQKLDTQLTDGKVVREVLSDFLIENYGAFSTTDIPTFGVWHDDHGRLVNDKCIEYRVSFMGKERIPDMFNKLSEIARLIGEDCLYVEAGQYAGLLYPK